MVGPYLSEVYTINGMLLISRKRYCNNIVSFIHVQSLIYGVLSRAWDQAN